MSPVTGRFGSLNPRGFTIFPPPECPDLDEDIRRRPDDAYTRALQLARTLREQVAETEAFGGRDVQMLIEARALEIRAEKILNYAESQARKGWHKAPE
jgi:hypothetical protein